MAGFFSASAAHTVAWTTFQPRGTPKAPDGALQGIAHRRLRRVWMTIRLGVNRRAPSAPFPESP
jgi:hypothetical protein